MNCNQFAALLFLGFAIGAVASIGLTFWGVFASEQRTPAADGELQPICRLSTDANHAFACEATVDGRPIRWRRTP